MKSSLSIKPKPLLVAKDMGLSIPVILPKERSLASNPLTSLRNTYLGSTKSDVCVLLKNINLDLLSGDQIGIIGPNGAGKTTLLRTLGGVYKPNSGTLISNCQPRGLFDVSMGFIAQATGLENIRLRALNLGFNRNEIIEMIPEIIEQSELGNYIHMPLETYSTGMRLRLAVSISLYAQPDVILLDEWIGSGDAKFQQAVTERMNKMIDYARGLIITSHNTSLLKRVCNRVLVINDGTIVFSGSVDDGIIFYKEEIISKKSKA